LMGNGDGTFVGAPQASAAYNGTNLGDINGDGIPDMIVPATGTVNGQTAVFTVQLGTAKGAFNPVSTIVAPPSVTFSVSEFTSPVTESTSNLTPSSYVLGDVNGDGKLDVVYVSNYRGYAIYGVALGNGDGTFAPVVITGFPQIAPSIGYDISTTIGSVNIGDFNHDGKADIIFNFNDIAGPFGTGLYLQGIGILPGNGAGTFGAPILTDTYNSGTTPPALGIPTISTIADLNGDGYPDLLASNSSVSVVNGVGVASGILQVYLGKDDGTFASPTAAITTTTLGQFVLADFNKDGKLDIAALTETSASQAQLQIALGNGNGTFGTPAVSNLTGGDSIRSGSLAAADFDGDGNIDLALLDYISYSGVFYGKGDGTFTSVPISGGVVPKDLLNLFVGGTGAAVADFNKDGKPDILAGGTILLNLYGSAPVITPSQASTTIAVTASPSGSILPGTSVTFTATITPGTSTATPGGMVTFLDGTTTLGTGTISSNVATYTTSALAVGGHSITAVYAGDTNFIGSTSSALTVTVSTSVISTTTSLSATVTSAVSGTSITFTAQVSPASGTGVPTGTVNFTDGTTALGSVLLDGTGKAAYTTSALAIGSHSIRAAYGGAATFVASTSSSLAVTITAPPVLDFAISVSPASSTVTHGNSISTTVSVTPANGFNQATSLTCTGAPSGATCTIAPASVTPNGTAASTATVTLQTSAGSASLPNTHRRFSLAATLPLGLIGTSALFGMGLGRRRRLPLLLTVLVTFAALVTISGCGHSSPASTATTFTPVTGTVSIIGTSGSLSHSATWTVNVQ
jgi:Bacterial Ig-like domain (group 3)/FG-GAP-like repeat